jgi:hypothetical protein
MLLVTDRLRLQQSHLVPPREAFLSVSCHRLQQSQRFFASSAVPGQQALVDNLYYFGSSALVLISRVGKMRRCLLSGSWTYAVV